MERLKGLGEREAESPPFNVLSDARQIIQQLWRGEFRLSRDHDSANVPPAAGNIGAGCRATTPVAVRHTRHVPVDELYPREHLDLPQWRLLDLLAQEEGSRYVSIFVHQITLPATLSVASDLSPLGKQQHGADGRWLVKGTG